ncbi:MAG: hypothetical protein JXA46_03245 [Dehalococcoidales bacterium]|nr:hypothetical protein [Dehalococcoidales bacterium]
MKRKYFPLPSEQPLLVFFLAAIILLGLVFLSAGGRPVSAAQTLTVTTVSDG